MGKRRRQTHQLAGDQFGEYEESRDEFGGGGGAKAGGGGGGGGGVGGGGTAGGSGPRGGAVALAPREVPKFLQAYAHLLPSSGAAGRAGGGEEGDEDGPLVVGDGQAKSNGKRARGRPSQDDDDDDEDGQDPVQAEAIARALEDNPELAAEVDKAAGGGGKDETPAARQLRRARAAAEKERGNDAFKDGRHAEAARHFSRALELDPSDAVFWSNRAAARSCLGEHEGALADARRAAGLRPGWAKAHQRVGAALEALSCPDEAEQAYRIALDLEPADLGLRASVERAAAAARKLRLEGKHVFKGGKAGAGGAGAGAAAKPAAAAAAAAPAAVAPAPPPMAAAGVKAKGLLSFGDEEEEDDDE